MGIAIEDLKEYRRIHSLFESESDRAVAVLGVTYLDHLLCRLLQRYFDVTAPGKRSIPRYFGGKAQLAAALGLIAPDVQHDLATLGWIRNAFAHELWTDSFDQDGVLAKCKELSLTTIIAPASLAEYSDLGPRLFRQAVTFLVLELLEVTTELAAVEVGRPRSAIYQAIARREIILPAMGYTPTAPDRLS